MPRPTSPHPDAERKSASPLHPRNRHLGRYDFPRLIAGSPELERFVILNPYGRQSIDFADPAAVKAFNRALLQQFYDVREWDIPDGYLCPPIPGRADYLHYLADLLGASHDGLIPRGPSLRALDVGTGANCIYPCSATTNTAGASSAPTSTRNRWPRPLRSSPPTHASPLPSSCAGSLIAGRYSRA